MGRKSHKDKGYLDELEYNLIELEFRMKEIKRRARNQDRNTNQSEKGWLKALRWLRRTIRKELKEHE